MENNGINKNDIYLYPDGIYIRETMKGYSYPKQVLNIDLSNVSALADYIEKGQPSDEFRTVLDSPEYATYHKVPWKVIMKLMEGAHYIFNNYNDGKTSTVLFGFVFQKFSDQSQLVDKRDKNGNVEYEMDANGQPKLDKNGNQIPVQVLNNQDDFKIVIPHQTINNPNNSKPLIQNDAELKQYLNDGYIYVGQFIFVNDAPEHEIKQIDIALANMPQNIYVFNHFGNNFNFAYSFAGLQTLPTFNQVNNGVLDRRVLDARHVYNYLSIPIDIKKNTGHVGINNDIDMSDFATQPEYVYYDGNLSVQGLLSRMSENDINDYKQWVQNVSLDKSPSVEEALNRVQPQNSDSIAPSNLTNDNTKTASASDIVNSSSTNDYQVPQQNQESPTTPPQENSQPTANSQNDTVHGLSEQDLLGGTTNTNNASVENTNSDLAKTLNDDDLMNDISGSLGTNNTQPQQAPQAEPASDNSQQDETTQDIINSMPADQRFVVNQDGNPVFYAKTHNSKPSDTDRQQEAYIDKNISQQHNDMVNNQSNPEIKQAISKLLDNA